MSNDPNDQEDQKISLLLSQLCVLEAQINESKKLYEQRDQLTLVLRDLGFTGPFECNGRTFTLINNFAQANVAYRAAFVRQWEVKIKEPKEPKPAKGSDKSQETEQPELKEEPTQ